MRISDCSSDVCSSDLNSSTKHPSDARLFPRGNKDLRCFFERRAGAGETAGKDSPCAYPIPVGEASAGGLDITGPAPETRDLNRARESGFPAHRPPTHRTSVVSGKGVTEIVNFG